jgi:plasmid maintenance system antidote protein VapI
MEESISPRNRKSQPQIFPVEIVKVPVAKIEWGMGKADNKDPPTIYLGAWLEEFNLDNGAAAEAAGCDQSYISNIVANRKPNVNVLILLRLSEFMGVTINDFYRKLPSKTHLAALKDLSPKAQATLLARFQKKA